MNYRHATSNDINAIAQLHATSWRNAYAGMLSDDFLANEVVADRQAVWEQRLGVPNPKQFVMVAEEGDAITGFVCLFLDHDAEYGALLDNLHVDPTQHGKGIGKQLMHQAMQWLRTHDTTGKMYLWVFADNISAIGFYEKLGGVIRGEKLETDFGNKPVRALRMVWM